MLRFAPAEERYHKRLRELGIVTNPFAAPIEKPVTTASAVADVSAAPSTVPKVDVPTFESFMLNDDAARERMHGIFAEQLGACIAAVSEPTSAGRRAALIATQMLGLALCRYVLALPLVASAPPAQLTADLGPTIQRYLTAALD